MIATVHLVIFAALSATADSGMEEALDRRLSFGRHVDYFGAQAAKGLFPRQGSWYAATLRRMQEPALFTASSNTNLVAYRFLYLPTRGRPFAARIVANEKDVYFRSVRLSGYGDHEPGYIAQVADHWISHPTAPKAIHEIESVIWDESFEPVYRTSLDGEDWVFEGLRHGRYRIVCVKDLMNRSRSPHDERFLRICTALLEAGSLRVEDTIKQCDELRLDTDPMRKCNPNNVLERTAR